MARPTFTIHESETVMEIINLTSTQPKPIPDDGVILFGCFDGVHLGHLALLDEAKRLAGNSHPVIVWVIDRGYWDCLTTKEEKCAVFGTHGAHILVNAPFEDICFYTGEEFFRRYVAPLKPYALVCGFNFRFGVKASCTASDLCTMAREIGCTCSVVSAMDRGDIPISSTVIRNAIHDGDLVTAENMLGRPLSYTSEILHGRQIGRTIHHPTLNQRIPENKISPPCGVYSCTVSFEKDGVSIEKGGVCNIGSRPTVNDDTSDVTLETYLFDFSGDLYGVTVTTSLLEMLRPEMRFDDLDELRAQIERDEIGARLSLSKRRPTT